MFSVNLIPGNQLKARYLIFTSKCQSNKLKINSISEIICFSGTFNATEEPPTNKIGNHSREIEEFTGRFLIYTLSLGFSSLYKASIKLGLLPSNDILKEFFEMLDNYKIVQKFAFEPMVHPFYHYLFSRLNTLFPHIMEAAFGTSS